jgi:hypothetical protein
MSFSRTQADQAPGSVAAPRFSVNNNFSPFQEASIYYAGTLVPKQIGAFVEAHYDAALGDVVLANVDIRRAKEGHLFGEDMVWGIDFNNSPSLQDIWNSSPSWGFPYYSSSLGAAYPGYSSSWLDQAQHQAYGLGSYMMWDDWLYGEVTLYKQPARTALQYFGQRIAGLDVIEGIAPYGRLAIQHSFAKDSNYFEIGGTVYAPDVRPGGDASAGTDHYLDSAIDASYQWYQNPNDVTASVLSGHAIFEHERQDLAASHALGLADQRNYDLNAFRADLSWAIDATYTPTVQYFTSRGHYDGSGHWQNGATNPSASGVVTELALTPWGKPDSVFGSRFNARLSLQYTAYSRFNGTTLHASDNNLLWIGVHLALAAFQ